jgi:hemerythrin-like domain-containing protein
MSTARHRHPVWAAASVTAAGVMAVALRTGRRRRDARDSNRPADASFMRAIHAALRRDMARLESLAGDIERRGGVPDQVAAGWQAFRQALETHHAAEDDDLWPVLREHLAEAEDRRQVDQMVEEHRTLPPAIAAMDAALANGQGARAAARELGERLRHHLDHEEERVFPLLERHLSRREWRIFLLTERRRRALRERPEFLTWVLDDASERDCAAVMAELPPPARVVYRRVLQPRYLAQRRWERESSDEASGATRRGAA